MNSADPIPPLNKLWPLRRNTDSSPHPSLHPVVQWRTWERVSKLIESWERSCAPSVLQVANATWKGLTAHSNNWVTLMQQVITRWYNILQKLGFVLNSVHVERRLGGGAQLSWGLRVALIQLWLQHSYFTPQYSHFAVQYSHFAVQHRKSALQYP